MGILGRINRAIKSSVNDMIDKMSDPAKEVDLLIIEMEEGLKEARKELIDCTATAKRADRECANVQGEVDLWQGRAETAVRAGDDGLAREALGQKMEAERRLEVADQTAAQQHGHVAELHQAIKGLQAKLKDVKLRRNTIKQRARAAKEGHKGVAGGKAFEEFDRLEAKIEAMEDVADIDASMDARDASTEAKFLRLEERHGRPELDDELEALKRRLEEKNS